MFKMKLLLVPQHVRLRNIICNSEKTNICYQKIHLLSFPFGKFEAGFSLTHFITYWYFLPILCL